MPISNDAEAMARFEQIAVRCRQMRDVIENIAVEHHKLTREMCAIQYWYPDAFDRFVEDISNKRAIYLIEENLDR